MKPPLPPEKIAEMLKAKRAKQAPGALIKNPITQGIGGSWVKK